MKRELMIALAVSLFAGLAHANDWIGIFRDTNHTYYGLGTSGTLYVFVNMETHDMNAVEFKLVFPSRMTPGTVVHGPDMALSIGSITDDWAGVFYGCHVGWWEICHTPVTSNPDCSDCGEWVHLQPGNRADPHIIQVVDCDGVIWEPRLYISCDWCAAENTSWGAIRNLF